MPRPTPARIARLTRPLLLASLLLQGACTTPPRDRSTPPTPSLAAPPIPLGRDLLPAWRTRFGPLLDTLAELDQPLIPHEAADAPAPPIPPAAFAPALRTLAAFRLAPGDTLLLPRVHGPETPFPDHHPLRQLAALRTTLARLALADGDLATALDLVRQNLAQARATLRSQAAIIPLIHATGVWQSALDGVHCLARSPLLSPAEARALLAELRDDARLAPQALDRAFRGELAHVHRVILDRLPDTDDPDLALSALASLGSQPPSPPAPGELGLGTTRHLLLDRPATLAALEADLAPYLAHFAGSARFPRGLYAEHTAATLARYREELGAFETYASGEGETSLALLFQARAALEATPNPIGKLLVLYLTPAWEALIKSTLRREAHRSALCVLLAWRARGAATDLATLRDEGLLPDAPADPFSAAALLVDPAPPARVWSVYADGEDQGGEAVPGNLGQPPDLVWLR